MVEIVIALLSFGALYKLFKKGVKTYNKYTQTDVDLYIHSIITNTTPSLSPMSEDMGCFFVDDLDLCSDISITH